MGRLKPYLPRWDGANPPLYHYSYVVEDVSEHEYRGKIRRKAKKSEQPFEGSKPWSRVKYPGLDGPKWHDVTAFLHYIDRDALD